MPRKHISDRTRLASTLILLGHVPYDHAKAMTEDQVISLYEWDHNILHETGHPDRDKFWNLTPRLIAAHAEKTKQDAKVIAKGRRIRDKMPPIGDNPIVRMAEAVSAGWAEGCRRAYQRIEKQERKRKIRSRGFDKTRRRKMDGTVVPR